MSEKIRMVYQGAKEEIIEKKSRFIATIVPVKGEGEAQEFIEATKKQYWNAAHNCFAFVIGDKYEIQRFSDDGEPGGTAGRPMLEVLVSNRIHGAAVVVTRYFGGTLLGTGGLVRAYQKAVGTALASCVILEKTKGYLMRIKVDYHGSGKVQYIVGSMDLSLWDVQYLDNVIFEVVLPCELKDAFIEKIMEATNATASVTVLRQVEYGMLDKKCVLL